MTLSTAWKRTVRADPLAPALWDATTGTTWTRADLERRAQDCSIPVRPGHATVFSAPNGIDWWSSFLGILHRGGVAVPLDPGEPEAARRDLEHRLARKFPAGIELIKLTSGSTGRPRALAFTGAQMAADGRQICATMGIGPKDINLALIPFGHSYGLGNLVVPLALQGTASVVGVAPLPHAIGDSIQRSKATVLPAVPALLRPLAESDVPAAALGSLRLVISAGSPLAPEIADAFARRFGRRVHNFYGSSETGGITFDGRPLRGVRLAFGRGGRFSVRSRAVGGRGVHRPADLGRRNERGELVLLGRTGRMIKVSGRRLDPAEVERALCDVPGVREAFVAPHPGRPETLAALVAPRGPAGPELTAVLRSKLAPWKIPRRFVLVDALPLTERGKPDRARMLALLR